MDYKWIVLALMCLHRVSTEPVLNVREGGFGVEIEGAARGGAAGLTDDEDLAASGSGSGSGSGAGELDAGLGIQDPETPVVPPVRDQLTSCELQAQMARQSGGGHPPQCLPDGRFSPVQCSQPLDSPDNVCSCVDRHGKEIHGSALARDKGLPDCEQGSNLPECVFQLVQYHQGQHLLGAQRPHCLPDGRFHARQCRGSVCYCVDQDTGRMMPGSQRPRGEDLDFCDSSDDTPESELPPHNSNEDSDDNLDIDEDTDSDFEPIIPDVIEPDQGINLDNKPEKEDDRKTGLDTNVESRGQGGTEVRRQPDVAMQEASQVLALPGILAAIIGGGVVLLLCTVLLVMFVVYRLRKKDEGSYPLDERRGPSYSYVRAPQKEFYA